MAKGKKNKRQPRKGPSIEDADLLQPIDMELIGSPDDPCFGKLYDLKAPECAMCGDAELCQIVNSQTLNAERLAEEKNNNFTDMEVIIPVNDIKKYYEGKLKKNGNALKSKRLTKKKFGITTKEFKNKTQ